MMNQHVQSGSSSGCGGDATMMHVKMETVVDEQNHATAFVLGCSQEESSAPGCEEDSAAHAYATYTEAGEACSPPAAAANSLDLMADAAATNTILLSSEKTFAHSSDFCSKAVMHLIEAVGRRWGLYETRERSQLFQSVQDEMAAQGYVLPVEKIRRKWNNLIVTYKRVKDRSRETGHAKTSWEFFDLMDATLCDTVGVQVMHSSKIKTTKGSVPPAKIAAKPHDGSEPGGAPYGDFTALAVVDRSMTHAATAGAHDVNNEIGSAVATVPSVTSVSLETTAAPELKPLVLLNGDIVTASVLSPCPSLVSSPYAVETLPPPGPSHSFELTTGNNAHHHHPRVKIRSGGARLKAPLLRSAGRRGGGGGGQEGQAPPPLQPPPPQRSNHNIHTLSSSSSAASLTSTFSLRSPFPTSYDASRTDGQMDAAAAELGGGSTSSSALLQELLRRQEERAYLEEAAGRRADARERRRERREVRMAESLGRMATALELLSSKQDTVIALLQRLAERK